MATLWPASADKRLGPAPLPGSHPHSNIYPVLGILEFLNLSYDTPSLNVELMILQFPLANIYFCNVCLSGVELPDYGGTIMFPSKGISKNLPAPTYDFESLDENTQDQLLQIINQDTFTR